jgi:methylase of polypeptide subunit release factors
MKGIVKKPYCWFFQNRRVRASKIIALCIFGFYPRPKNRRTLWDSTSVLLKDALNRWVQNDSSVLEIGTGDIGLLSNYLTRIKKVDITAVDICNDFIINSQLNRNKNAKNVKFLTSNLFESLSGLKFDNIFSNPPYVKTANIDIEKHIKYHGFTKECMISYASDGGEDGLNTINRIIIESKDYLNPNGALIIGYNEKHIDNDRLQRIVNENNYYVFNDIRSKYNDCRCLNLKIKNNG